MLAQRDPHLAREAVRERCGRPNVAKSSDDCLGTASFRLLVRRRVSRAESDGQQCNAKDKGYNPFNRLVRVESLNGLFAENEAEATRDRGAEHEPAQKRNAVRARARAPDDDECRSESERARRGGESVEEDVSSGVDHVLGAARPPALIEYAVERDWPGASALCTFLRGFRLGAGATYDAAIAI